MWKPVFCGKCNIHSALFLLHIKGSLQWKMIIVFNICLIKMGNESFSDGDRDLHFTERGNVKNRMYQIDSFLIATFIKLHVMELFLYVSTLKTKEHKCWIWLELGKLWLCYQFDQNTVYFANILFFPDKLKFQERYLN